MAANVQSMRWLTPIAVSRPRSPRFPPVAVVAPSDVLALVVAADFTTRLTGLAIAYGLAVMAVLAIAGSYRIGISPSLARDAGRLAGCAAVPALGAALLAPSSAPDMVRLGAFAAVGLVVARMASYRMLRLGRSRGWLVEPTLIVGAGRVGAEVGRVLQEHPEFGLLPVGYLDSFQDDGLPAPILGSVALLDAVLREYDVRRLLIAFGATREPDMVPIVRACERASVDVHVLPRFFELGVSSGRNVDDIWGLPFVWLRRSALRSNAWRVKRMFDVAVAATGLVITAPLLVVIALAVRLSSPGPIFFRQKRVGQRGRVVDVLKFRTMHVNFDSDTQWSAEGDARTTALGRLLRRTSLDELPQLINVLRGEMSLVGPRPERPYFVDRFRDEVAGYGDRHRVPVGLTGWAQVHGLRGDTSIEERARFDNNYIENWTLAGDILILLRTVGAVVRAAFSRSERGALDPGRHGSRTLDLRDDDLADVVTMEELSAS